MNRMIAAAALVLATASPALAQNWSFGASTGPFVFGDFLERTLRPGNEQGPNKPDKLKLSAATRPGLALDVERSLSDRWGVRLEATLARAPLSIKQENGEGVDIDAGDLDVSTWMLPVVFRINPRGAVRVHLLAGPALALYHVSTTENAAGAEPAFSGTKAQWGVAAGAGAAWWLSERFAIEGNITDTVTSSPIDDENFADTPGVEIPKPHNIHTTVGVRWKF